MESFPLRIRIDRAIAEKAMRMAAAKGMELPDVIRMMLTKAVRIGDFSIEGERPAATAQPQERRPYYAYEERQWNSQKQMLDAESVLEHLIRAIAERTALLDEAAAASEPDTAQLERIRDERNEACKLFEAFDPTDGDTLAKIIERFGPPADPAEATP
jgi:antitoxin component of RelBE/YafQ-DinJ toxin-antitoxin module